MSGLGEVKVSLGLDTTAATAQLKKFFSQFGEPVQDPLKAVDKGLDKTIKKAKDLGFEWDSTQKQFKSSQGFTQTLTQMKSTLSATAKAAKDSGISFKQMGDIVKTSGEQYKMIAGGMQQAQQKMKNLGDTAKTTKQDLQSVTGGQVATGLNNLGSAAQNATGGFDKLGTEAQGLNSELKNIGQGADQGLSRLGDVADATTGDINELGNASTGLVNKLKNIGQGSTQGLQKLGTDAKSAGSGLTQLGNAATDAGNDLIKIYNGGKGLAQVSSSAKTLGRDFSNAAKGTQQLATATGQLGQKSSGISQLGRSVTGLSTSTKSAATGFGTLGNALQQANQKAQPLTALPQKIKPINAAMKSAGQAAAGAGTQFQKAGQQSKGFTDTVNEGFKQMLIGIPQGIGMAIGNALIAPLRELAGVVPAAVEEFNRLDESLRLTLEISGAGAQAFGELKEAILSVSSVTAATATDIAAIAQALSKAGFSLDEVKVAMLPIAQAAEATGTAYDTMGDIVVSALGQFRLEAEQASRVADTLVVAANSSNQSVTDLGEAFKYVGPVAAGLNNSIEDVSVALGVLANAGIKGSSAGTALRTAMSNLATAAGNADAEFLKLSRGSGRIAKALKLVQAQMTDANGELKTGTDFIYALKDAMESLPQQEQALVAKALAGQEGLSAMNALIGASSEEIDGLADSLANAAGAAESQAGKALAGLSGQIKLLQSNISSALVTIGEVIATVLTPVVTTIRVILEAFNALPGPIKAVGVAIALMGGAVATATVAMNAFAAASKTAFGSQLIGNIQKFTQSLTAANIAQTLNGMVTSFKNMSSILAGALTNGLTGATQGITKFVGAIKSGTILQDAAKGIQSMGAALQGIVKPAGAAQLSLNLAAAGGTNLGTAAAAGATGATGLGTAAAGATGGVGALTSAIGSFLVAIAPIALAIGGVVLAVKAVTDYMGKWNSAQEPLKASTKVLTDEIKDQSNATDTLQNVLNPMENILEGMAGGYDNWGKSIEDALGPVDRLLSLMGPLWSAFKFGAELIGRFDGWLKQKTQVAALNDEHGKFKGALAKTNAELESNSAKMRTLNPLSEEYGKLAKRNAELSATQVKATEDRVKAIDKQIEALMKDEKHNKLVIEKLKEHKAELQAGLAIQQANADASKTQYQAYIQAADGIQDYTAALDKANQEREKAEAYRDTQALAQELEMRDKVKKGIISEAEATAATAKAKLQETNKVMKAYEAELEAIEDLYDRGLMSAEDYNSKTATINEKNMELLKNRIEEEKALTQAVAAAVADRLDAYMNEVTQIGEAYGKVYEMLNNLTSIGSGGISAFKSLASQMTNLRIAGIDKVKSKEIEAIDKAAENHDKRLEASHKMRMANIEASGASEESKSKMKESAEKSYNKMQEAAQKKYDRQRETAEQKHAAEKKRLMQEQIKMEEAAHKANMKFKELEIRMWYEQATIQNKIAQEEIKVAKLKAKASGASAEELQAYDDALRLTKKQGELLDTQFKLKNKVLEVQGRTTEAAIATKAAQNDVNSEFSNSYTSVENITREMGEFVDEVDTAIKEVSGIKDGLDPIPDKAQDVFDETLKTINDSVAKADFKSLRTALEREMGPESSKLLASKLTEAYDDQGKIAADKFAKNFLERFGTEGKIPKNWIADQLKAALQEANGVTAKEAKAIFDDMPNAIPVEQIARIMGTAVGGGYEEGLMILQNTPLPGQTLAATNLQQQMSTSVATGAQEGVSQSQSALQQIGGFMLESLTNTFMPGLGMLTPQVSQWANTTGSQAGSALEQGLAGTVGKAFEPIGEAAKNVGPWVEEGLQNVAPALEGIGTKFGTQLENWGVSGGKALGEGLVQDAANAGIDFVQFFGDALMPGVGTIKTAVENDWMGVGTTLGNIFGQDTVNAIVGWEDEVQNSVANFFSDGNRVENQAREIGNASGKALGDGIKSAVPIVDATATTIGEKFGNIIPKETIKDELIQSLAINSGSDLARAEEAFNKLPDLIPREEITKVLGMEAIGGGVAIGEALLNELVIGPDGQGRLQASIETPMGEGVDAVTEEMTTKGEQAGNNYGKGVEKGIETGGKQGLQNVEEDSKGAGEKTASNFQGPLKKKAEDMRKAFNKEFKEISKQFNTAFKEANFDELSNGLRDAVVEPIEDAVEEIEKLRAPDGLANNMSAVGEAAQEVGSSGMAQEVKDASNASNPLKSNMQSTKNAISSSVGPARNLASSLERAARAAERAARARFTGGPVKGGESYQVNEFGTEMFRSSSGQISDIKAPAFGQWRAPSSGTVIPAHIANAIRAQQEASKANVSMQNFGGGAGPRTSSKSAHAGGPNYQRQMVKELKNLANSGGTTTNNIQIQSQAPIRDASHILVQANRLKNLRRRR